MAIRHISVGPQRSLRLAAADNLPNLVGIAGPNGAGKSTVLDLIRASRHTAEPGTQILFTGPHRTWRNSSVSEVSALGWSYDYSDILMQESIPGSQFPAAGSLQMVYGQPRLTSSADDSQALVKTAIIRIRNKRRKYIEKEFSAQGKQIVAGTVPDLFEPFAILVTTLLPHLSWVGIDDTNESSIRCLFRPIGRPDVVPFDIDELSSGEKAAIALFLPFIEQQVQGLLGNAALPLEHGVVPYTMLLDEPEIHLHPLLQLNALEYMRRLAQEGRCQFIFATQSPTLLDALADEELYLLSPSELAPDNQLSRLTDTWERLDLARSLTGSTHTLTRCKPIVFIEGRPDKTVTASDERLMKLLVPEVAHWALVSADGRNEVVTAVTKMRESEVNLPGMPIFGLVDADTDVSGLPEWIISWPVAMIENLLLDVEAIWKVLKPYRGNLPFQRASDVERTLDGSARGQEENEVRLRVKRSLPGKFIRIEAYERDTALSDLASQFDALTHLVNSVDFEKVVGAAKAAVKQIIDDGTQLERFHGKNILDAWLNEHHVCDRTGLSRNAFLTQLAQDASSSDRCRKLTEQAISRIRLYFPPGLDDLLSLGSGDESVDALVPKCRAARSAWEAGSPDPADRVELRSQLTAAARQMQQAADTDAVAMGRELMRLACAIGTA